MCKMASLQQDSYEDWQSTKKTVLERSCHMFNNPFMSDIELKCESSDKKFFAHKYVLATSSAVFYAMFYGKLADMNSTVHLSDTDDEYLEEFLRFLYTDECNLTADNAMSVLYLAKKYIVPSLAEKCIEFLESIFTAENILTILHRTVQLDEKNLEKKCWDFVELHASEVVASVAFIDINQSTLTDVLKRESLNVKEYDLYNAVLKWSEEECSRKGMEANATNKRTAIANAIYQIRFASMTLQEFGQITSQSSMLTPEEIIFFYEKFSGVERVSEVWNMSDRRVRNENLLRCCRFSEYTNSWSGYEDKYTLCVSFNRAVKIHGVRLLGWDDKEYDVKLKILSHVIEKKFISQKNSCDISGFDVMLPTPVTVQANIIIPVEATISGYSYFNYGVNGRNPVTTNGITVTFYDLPRVRSDKIPKERQFDEIIFSEVRNITF